MALLKLPSIIVSQSDIARLIRELNGLNDFFIGARNRPSGTSMQPPRLSRLMDRLARENEVNLLEEKHRTKLMEMLKDIHKNAPSLHISFAVEPSPKALEQILIWMRQNIHPQVLLSVGLQPAIAAGCILRTTNKIFDLSLRTYLKQQSQYLTQLIRGAVDGSS
jgi:F0F1-type ATP synthase delta subunit